MLRTFDPELLRMSDGSEVTDWEKRRIEIVNILAREEYGSLPPKYAPGHGRVVSTAEKCASGHAWLERVEIDVETEKGIFTFPIHLFIPKAEKKVPAFLLINFRPDAYDMYYPAEEILDRGFAIAVIHYNDVTKDNQDMSDGIAGMFTRPSDGTGYGKISLWAYAMSRCLDYLITRPEIDADEIAAIGHSRLGKTALWAGANDTRFKYVMSNDSGCSGAAYEREKHNDSETVKTITEVFPYWFCENFRKYADHPDDRPFDQHWLIAASCPRNVVVHSASLDCWADPMSEQISCVAASPAWHLCGKKGFIGPEEPAETGVSYNEGEIGYLKRDGIHFLGRPDWLDYMIYIEKHMGKH